MKKTLFVLILALASTNLFSAGRDIFKYIQNDDFENIKKEILILNNINITDYESFENTPLMEVSYKLQKDKKAYQDIAVMMLAKGANANYKNVFGTDALHYAAKLHQSETFIKNCQMFGANLENTYYTNNETLLHASMENGHYLSDSITRYLVNNTKLINTTTKTGFTTLMLAMMSNCKHYEGCGFKRQQIKDLVNGGAIVEIEDNAYGMTALEFGVDSMNQTYVRDYQDLQFLIDHGAIVDEDAVDLAEDYHLKEYLRSQMNNK